MGSRRYPSIVLGTFIVACASAQGPKQVSEATRVYEAAKDAVFSIETDKATGTGFLSMDGSTIITCYHVIEGASKLTVKGSMDARWSVTAVRFDKKLDLALLTVDRPSSRRQLPIALRNPTVGEKVYVIGNALGVLTRSLSEGIVSGLRSLDSTPLLQVTAAISPGVSGSPILNSKGEVVGVVSFTLSKGQSLNLGVSSTALRSVATTKEVKVDEFFVLAGRSPTEVSPPVSKQLLDEGQAVQLARLASQFGRAYVELHERDATPNEQSSAAAGFSRYWSGASRGFEGFALWPELVSCVDRFELAASQMAQAELEVTRIMENRPPIGSSSRDYAEHRERFQEALSSRSKRNEESSKAFFSFSTGLFRLFYRESAFLEVVEPTALIHFFGTSIKVSDDPYGRIVPEYASPETCRLATPLLPPGAWEKLKAVTSGTYAERKRIYAVANAGDRIFAVKVGADEFKDVRNWRDVYNLTTGLHPETIAGGIVWPTGQILVGLSRATARPIDVTFGG